MQVLEKHEELVGKTIAYVDMAQYAEQVTLVTTDGDILMVQAEYIDDEDFSLRVLREPYVVQRIRREGYIQKELAKLGLFDLAAFEKERAERQAKERELSLIATEKRERQQLAQLKLKYPEEATV